MTDYIITATPQKSYDFSECIDHIDLGARVLRRTAQQRSCTPCTQMWWLCHDFAMTVWEFLALRASIGLRFCSPSIWSHQSDHFTLRGHGFWAVRAVAIRVGGWWQGYNPLALSPQPRRNSTKQGRNHVFKTTLHSTKTSIVINHDQSWSIIPCHALILILSDEFRNQWLPSSGVVEACKALSQQPLCFSIIRSIVLKDADQLSKESQDESLNILN